MDKVIASTATDKLIVSTATELSNLIEESLRKVLSDMVVQQSENNALPELLTIDQAAKYLNLAKQTLYGFTSKGDIPYLKRAKKLYFKKTELNNWITEGKK